MLDFFWVVVSGRLRMFSTRWFCHMHTAVQRDERDQADDEPGPELREVLDETQPVLVRDRSQRGGHQEVLR